MQTSNRFFDDLARMAGGAASAMTGLKAEIEGLVRQQIERLLSEMHLVPREEFEAVKAMAAKARAEQEALARRVAELEARPARPGPARATTARKPRAGAARTTRPRAKPKT